MSIKTKKQDTSDNSMVNLDITVSGMVITVGAASFRVAGEDFVLDDDYEYTVEESSEQRLLTVALAKEISSGDGVVVVDEEAPGDGRFPWDGSGYEPLCRVFFGNIPPDTTDLDAVSWVRLEIEKNEATARAVDGAEQDHSGKREVQEPEESITAVRQPQE
jgi:hypothetical protein